MKRIASAGQRGAALVVGLIMLVLITIMLITALNLGTSNFRSVSNMQFREEAIAAANRAIELVISSNFATSPTAQEINVDIDQDDTVDYVVLVDEPQCVQATIAEEFEPRRGFYHAGRQRPVAPLEEPLDFGRQGFHVTRSVGASEWPARSGGLGGRRAGDPAA